MVSLSIYRYFFNVPKILQMMSLYIIGIRGLLHPYVYYLTKANCLTPHLYQILIAASMNTYQSTHIISSKTFHRSLLPTPFMWGSWSQRKFLYFQLPS